jgi:hypothetical protein
MFIHIVGCLSPPTDKEWGQSIMWGVNRSTHLYFFFNLVKVLLYFIRIYLQIYDCISEIILYLCDYEKNGMAVS